MGARVQEVLNQTKTKGNNMKKLEYVTSLKSGARLLVVSRNSKPSEYLVYDSEREICITLKSNKTKEG